MKLTKVKENIDYYFISPHIQKKISTMKSVMKNLIPHDKQQQGILFEELVFDLIKTNGHYLQECSRLAFYLPRKVREQLKKQSNYRPNAESYTYLEFDGVFISKRDMHYSMNNGFELIKFKPDQSKFNKYKPARLNQSDPLIIPKGELVIIEIKQAYNLYNFALFIDKVIGLKEHWNSFQKKKIHCLFFFDVQKYALKSKDFEFVQFLLKEASFPNLCAQLHEEVPKHKQQDFLNKMPYLNQSFKIFQRMAKLNQITIDFIYYDSLVLSLSKLQSNVMENCSLTEKLNAIENDIAQLKKDFNSLKLFFLIGAIAICIFLSLSKVII